MKSLKFILIACFGLFVTLSACNDDGYEDEGIDNDDMEMADNDANMHQNDDDSRMNNNGMMDVTSAVAVVNPTNGNKAKGTVTFSEGGNGVQVKAEFSGLPQGKHGFHVHLYGDCSASDGTSAGTHFNFEGSSKNPPANIDRITGNLGNVEAGSNGSATADTTISNTTLKAILGRAVIVHAKENDPTQPPIGAAGARLGCGVIGIANADNGMNENDNM